MHPEHLRCDPLHPTRVGRRHGRMARRLLHCLHLLYNGESRSGEGNITAFTFVRSYLSFHAKILVVKELERCRHKPHCGHWISRLSTCAFVVRLCWANECSFVKFEVKRIDLCHICLLLPFSRQSYSPRRLTPDASVM